MQKVLDALNPDQLLAAAANLRGIAAGLHLDDKNRKIYFLRDAQHAWLEQWLREAVQP